MKLYLLIMLDNYMWCNVDINFVCMSYTCKYVWNHHVRFIILSIQKLPEHTIAITITTARHEAVLYTTCFCIGIDTHRCVILCTTKCKYKQALQLIRYITSIADCLVCWSVVILTISIDDDISKATLPLTRSSNTVFINALQYTDHFQPSSCWMMQINTSFW